MSSRVEFTLQLERCIQLLRTKSQLLLWLKLILLLDNATMAVAHPGLTKSIPDLCLLRWPDLMKVRILTFSHLRSGKDWMKSIILQLSLLESHLILRISIALLLTQNNTNCNFSKARTSFTTVTKRNQSWPLIKLASKANKFLNTKFLASSIPILHHVSWVA